MTRDEAFEVLSEAVHRIAPEVDLSRADRDAELAEELDLDSMDMMELTEALHARTGVDIEEDDRARLTTIDAVLDHLVAHAP